MAVSAPTLTIRLPGTSTWVDYSDFIILGNQSGGGIVGGGSVSQLSSVLSDVPCTKSHQLNSAPQLGFVLGPPLGGSPPGGGWIKPPRFSEVRLDTPEFTGFFTGFITNEPGAEPFGEDSDGTPILGYHYLAIGEEILLDMNAIGVIPPFVSVYDGFIIAELIAKLSPAVGSPPVSRFDTSGILTFGSVNEFFTVNPQERFSDVVARLLANQSVKLWFKRGVVSIARFNDGIIYIADEDNDPNFSPYDLNVNPIPTSVRNDLTGFGDIERKEYAREYFVGDGITPNFPLKLPVFGASGTPLFGDDFSAAAIDTTHWLMTDPTGIFTMFGGSLNIVGTSSLGNAQMMLNQGLEVKGKHKIHGGEFRFVGAQNGIVCALSQTASLPPFINLAAVNFGFRLTPSSSQTAIQAIVNGALVGDIVTTQANKTYAFHIYIDSQVTSRSWRPWWSKKNPFGGGTANSEFIVTFVVEENDQLQVKAPTKYQIHQETIPGTYTGSPPVPAMPAWLYIVVASVNSMNCAVNFFSVTETIQATLMFTEPLMVGSPPHLGSPPTVGSPAFFKIRRGIMGFVGETDADATIQVAQQSYTLSFFQETRPEETALIELRYRGSGAAVARVINQASITAQAAAFGDSGVRSDVLTNIVPLPATSEILEAALQAFLDDQVNPQFSGDWTLLEPPYAPLSSSGSPPVGDFPIPGRFLRVISSKRLGSIAQFDGLIQTVQTDIVTCDSGSPAITQYLYKLSFAEIATRRMDQILQRFAKKPPAPETLSYNPTAGTIAGVDTTLIPTQFVDDLTDVKFVGRTSTGSPPKLQYTLDGGRALGSNQFYEVRWSDGNWGQDGVNLIGRFGNPGSPAATDFQIDRVRRDEWVFVKLLDKNFSPWRLSRHPAFVRINYPMPPAQPILDTVVLKDTTNPIFMFDLGLGGEISDVYQMEIRAADNVTILDTLPIFSETDLQYTFPNPLNVATITIWVYLINLLGEYSPGLQAATNIEAGLIPVGAVGSNLLPNPGFEISTGIYPTVGAIPADQLIADGWYATQVVPAENTFLTFVEKNGSARTGGRNAHITLNRALTAIPGNPSGGIGYIAELSQLKGIGPATPIAPGTPGMVPVTGGQTIYYGGWLNWIADADFGGTPAFTGPILSISKSGTTVTVQTASAYGVIDGTEVEISGTGPAGYDGVFQLGITVIDATHFSYQDYDGSPKATLTTGTVTFPGDALAYVGYVIGFYDVDGNFIDSTFNPAFDPNISSDFIEHPTNAWVFVSGLHDVPQNAAYAVFIPTIFLVAYATINASLHNYLEVRWDDTFFEIAKRGTHSDYAIIGNPLTAHDNGGASLDEILIATFTVSSGGVQVVCNSGTILLVNRTTLYYVFYDDPGFSGGAVAYHVTEDPIVAKLGENRFFVGSIFTPAAGAPDSIGNNDGGHGSVPASNTKSYFIIPPDSTNIPLFATSASGGGTATVTNAGNMLTSDETTFAAISVTGTAGNINEALLFAQAAPGGISRRYSKITVNIDFEVTVNTDTSAEASLTVRQWIDAVVGFVAISGVSAFAIAASTTYPRQVIQFIIPPTINLAALNVFILDEVHVGSGTITMNVYRIWADAIGA